MQPEQPQFVPPSSPLETTRPPAGNRKRTILALWLIIGPTALIVTSLILYAIANLLFIGSASNGEPFGQQSILQSGVNILLFIVGATAVLTWLPGLITGIVLLTTKKK